MPTQFAGRIGLIIVLLLAALIVIFPPAKMFDGSIPLLERTSLKPGIDMVGGSSLVYQIQAPEGSFDDDLVVKVMTALKKRVDPDGIRNLVWRPQGKNRLEIQMPRSAQANEAIAKRDAFAAAQRKLDATNIKTSEVTYAIENLEGEARAASLRRLAMDSQTRAKLFEEPAHVDTRQLQDGTGVRASGGWLAAEEPHDDAEEVVDEVILLPVEG